MLWWCPSSWLRKKDAKGTSTTIPWEREDRLPTVTQDAILEISSGVPQAAEGAPRVLKAFLGTA